MELRSSGTASRYRQIAATHDCLPACCLLRPRSCNEDTLLRFQKFFYRQHVFQETPARGFLGR